MYFFALPARDKSLRNVRSILQRLRFVRAVRGADVLFPEFPIERAVLQQVRMLSPADEPAPVDDHSIWLAFRMVESLWATTMSVFSRTSRLMAS